MRKIPVKCIGLAALLGGLFHSCTESQQDTPDWVDGKSEILFRTGFRQGTSSDGLLTKLYVFSTDGNGGGVYQLSDSLPQVISGTTKLKIKFTDLEKKDYRFLFVATSETKPEIRVRPSDNSLFAFGTPWEKVAVAMAADSLSVDNYYGITDMKGVDILTSGNITGNLTRLVGQMVFCFYKASEGGVDDPQVLSVLDRISSIDITYQNAPLQIKFDASNKPVPVPGSTVPLHHTVRFSLTADGQKVELPQTGIPVEVNDSIPGGAILKGTCLLPVSQGVRVSMTFHYYDTTPICRHMEKEHTHDVTCYTPEELSLSLPKQESLTGLSVLPNHFTINNALLPCNRVIDVVHTSGIDVDTVWEED